MTHSLSLTDVSRIATEVVRAEHAGLDVVGVTGGGGDGDYTEVMLRVQGCRQHPCQVSLGVFRDVEESVMRADILQKVRQHVEEHRREAAAAGSTS